MKSYAEYLKSLGATEDEIKILDTPTARKAYENQVTDAEKRIKAATDATTAYEARANAWWEEQKGNLSKAQADAVTARREAESLRASILEANRQGLIDVARDLGLKLEDLEHKAAPAAAAAAAPANTMDFDKYTTEVIIPLAEREGDAIAVAQDIAAEHAVLFPGRRLSFRDLRQKAVAQKKSVEAVWLEEFKVPEAREAKLKADKDAELESVRKAERDKVNAEWAARVSSNPNLRTPEPSTSPFVPRTGSDPRVGKQPWEVGSSEQLADVRVRKGVELALKRETAVH